MTYFLLQSGALFLAAFFIGCWCGCLIKSALRRSDADLATASGPALAPAGHPVIAKAQRQPEPAPRPQAPIPQPLAVAAPRPQTPVGPPPGSRVAPEAVAAATAIAAATAVRPAQQVDDLKRIKGIGPELEMKLNDAGVRRYAEIAGWSTADVARVNRMIGQDGRIQHENWVEQAQILARGEETAFSRRMDRREVADGRADTWTPTAPNEVARQAASASQAAARTVVEPPPVRPAPVAAATIVAPASSAALAVGAAAAAAAAIAASTTASARQAPAAPPQATPAPATPAPARPVAAPPAPVAGTSTISMRPAPGQGNLRRFVRLAAPEGKADDISLVSGVGDKVAGELNRYGVYHYWQLAAMGPDDIEYLESRLGLRGRIRREEWQEQARELMAGRPPRGLLDRSRATQPVETRPVVPAAVPSVAPVPAPTPAPAQVAKPVAPLAPPPTVQTAPAPVVQTPPPAAKPAPIKTDDLALISGIGDKLASDLGGLGLVSFAQLATLRPDEVDQLETRLGLRGRVRREEWQEQARELMAGKAPRGAIDRARAAQMAPEPSRPVTEPVANKPVTPPVPAALSTTSVPSMPPSTATDSGQARAQVTPAPVPAPPQPAAPVQSAPVVPPPRPPVQAPPVVVQTAPAVVPPPPAATQPAPVMTGVAAAAAAASAAIAGATSAAVAKVVAPAPVQAPPAPVAVEPVSTDPNWQPRSRASNSAARGPRNDLKRIKGIGVVIDKKLEAMGITTYEQIAAWTTADIDKVSNALDFKGRIEREQWVQQARILSGGGQTDFSRRMDRGDGVV